MKYLLTILILVLAAGCHTCPSEGDKFKASVTENVRAWGKVGALSLALPAGEEIAGKLPGKWVAFAAAGKANAQMIEAAAAGNRDATFRAFYDAALEELTR